LLAAIFITVETTLSANAHKYLREKAQKCQKSLWRSLLRDSAQKSIKAHTRDVIVDDGIQVQAKTPRQRTNPKSRPRGQTRRDRGTDAPVEKRPRTLRSQRTHNIHRHGRNRSPETRRPRRTLTGTSRQTNGRIERNRMETSSISSQKIGSIHIRRKTSSNTGRRKNRHIGIGRPLYKRSLVLTISARALRRIPRRERLTLRRNAGLSILLDNIEKVKEKKDGRSIHQFEISHAFDA